jgi:hypothetical chaperone protein
MAVHVGIDFGTTNTALALADDEGPVALADLPGLSSGDEATQAKVWRTVLHFDSDATPLAGAPAIARYVQNEGQGRLIQSIKSHLASASFTRTMIDARFWTLESLVAAYLKQLRAAVKRPLPSRAVVGRPVRYWGADNADDDARAVGRMRAALAEAGFTEVVFELEPIAAALRYAAGLDHEEVILVADFGGGTSDFSLLRVGPKLAPGDAGVVLATGGVALGGDSFDARIIDALVAPPLGRDTTYRDTFGAMTPVPHWMFLRLRRWHHLSFLKEASTLELLDRIHHGSSDPARIARLLRLVEDDLGLPLHQAVERCKVSLSAHAEADLVQPQLDLAAKATRGAFSAWVVPELDDIDAVVSDVLSRAGVTPAEVDTVFATGGSALVPAVRRRLADRFGEAKLAGGEELTSVAWGLAARARQLFAGT